MLDGNNSSLRSGNTCRRPINTGEEWDRRKGNTLCVSALPEVPLRSSELTLQIRNNPQTSLPKLPPNTQHPRQETRGINVHSHRKVKAGTVLGRELGRQEGLDTPKPPPPLKRTIASWGPPGKTSHSLTFFRHSVQTMPDTSTPSHSNNSSSEDEQIAATSLPLPSHARSAAMNMELDAWSQQFLQGDCEWQQQQQPPACTLRRRQPPSARKALQQAQPQHQQAQQQHLSQTQQGHTQDSSEQPATPVATESEQQQQQQQAPQQGRQPDHQQPQSQQRSKRRPKSPLIKPGCKSSIPRGVLQHLRKEAWKKAAWAEQTQVPQDGQNADTAAAEAAGPATMATTSKGSWTETDAWAQQAADMATTSKGSWTETDAWAQQATDMASTSTGSWTQTDARAKQATTTASMKGSWKGDACAKQAMTAASTKGSWTNDAWARQATTAAPMKGSWTKDAWAHEATMAASMKGSWTSEPFTQQAMTASPMKGSWTKDAFTQQATTASPMKGSWTKDAWAHEAMNAASVKGSWTKCMGKAGDDGFYGYYIQGIMDKECTERPQRL